MQFNQNINMEQLCSKMTIGQVPLYDDEKETGISINSTGATKWPKTYRDKVQTFNIKPICPYSKDNAKIISPENATGATDASDSKRHYSLDDFELISLIGKGSYGSVLMAELRKTKQMYAIKAIQKVNFISKKSKLKWLHIEKRVLQTATNHPFLVGLHSCFQTPSRIFFVTELVRGGDLMFHMDRHLRLPEEHAQFYSAEIAVALSFLHHKGVIFRDLKLENILLDHEGHIKLTDYGLCKAGFRQGDRTRTFCGTPCNMAPEVIRGDYYGFAVDWWALGVLIFEMIAGYNPFEPKERFNNPKDTDRYIFRVIIENPISFPPFFTENTLRLLMGFLNKRPDERLGCSSLNSFDEVKSHQFFRNIDWEMLEQRKVTPPYKPHLDSDRDVENFPIEFTDESVAFLPDDPSAINKIDQSEFEGFDYVNPILMS